MTPRVVVLQSFGPPRPTTNPYLVQLLRSLPEQVDVHCFSWRRALFGKYDVLHVHWPEHLVNMDGLLRLLLRRVLVLSLIARLLLLRTAVVRTVHNVAPHEEMSRASRWLLRALEKREGWWIRLNDFTPTPVPERTATVLHGHYRDWYPPVSDAGLGTGRILYFGLIRPYKGVDALVKAFSGLHRPDLSLRIVGRVVEHPRAAALVDLLERAQGDDPRISLHLDHASDEALARELERAALVVLPYRGMNNSGATLLALSLRRPVLVPRGPVTEALAREVGSSWVLLYDDELSPSALEAGMERASTCGPGEPDLTARDWTSAGQAHHRVYAAAAAGGHTGIPRNARERSARTARQ